MMTSALRYRTLALLLVLALALSGCRPTGGASITVAGSTSVQPFAELLSEEFVHVNSTDRISIQGGGSSAGIEAVYSGAAQIGMSSRELKGDETKLVRIEIARDAIAVVVHPKNPVTDLSLDQVLGIFSGKLVNWSQVGGASHPIVVVTREEGSGTRGAFQELVMGKTDIYAGALVQDSNGAVRQLVRDDPNAVGYISLGLVDSSVRAVSLDQAQATVEHVADGSYRLVRPFLFVLREPPSGGATLHFIEYTLSAEGQRLLAEEGLLPATRK